jgi:predicted DNA-binding transcriptional regulator AlpA
MKRLISLTELRSRMGGIGRTTLWRLQTTDPDFPGLVEITPGRAGVYEDEAEAYIASRPRKTPGRPRKALADSLEA